MPYENYHIPQAFEARLSAQTNVFSTFEGKTQCSNHSKQSSSSRSLFTTRDLTPETDTKVAFAWCNLSEHTSSLFLGRRIYGGIVHASPYYQGMPESPDLGFETLLDDEH